MVPGGLGGKESSGERVQEQPGKGKPGSEHQLCARQTSRRVARAVTQASEGQAPCLAELGGHEANASVLGRAGGSSAGA